MNISVKNIIIFVAGGILGAACGVLGTRKHYKAKYKKEADEKIASMEKYVQKIEKIHRDAYKTGLHSDALGYSMSKDPEVEKVEGGESDTQEEQVDYNEISMRPFRKAMERMAKEQHPTDEDDKEEVYRESELLRQKELNDSMNNAEPYVITPEEDAIDAVSSRETLYYLMEDDMMLDENEEIIPDYHALLGDLIHESGFDESEEEELYIKNPSLGVIYEVNKIVGGDDY